MISLVETVLEKQRQAALEKVDITGKDPFPAPRVRRRGGFKRGGENCRNKKLAAEAVQDVRRRRAAGEGLKSIGKRHDISVAMVSKIVRGKAYGWVRDAA